MPTLRIQFPEKDTPTILGLEGNRITIGRRADNTVQIVDRLISAFHAELVLEGDHYRIHDLGSTNGTRVNGEPITDFHLRESCTVGFGPVECEFSPEAPQQATAVKLPTHVEVEAVRKQNEDFQGKLQVIQQELETMRTVRNAADDEAGQNLLKSEMERLVRERSEMQLAAQERDQELTALRTELARMNRDRQNLQDALSQAQAEIAHLKQGQGIPAAAAEDVRKAAPAVSELPAAAAVGRGIAALPKPTSVATENKPAIPAASPRTPAMNPSAPGGSAIPAATPRPAVAATSATPRPGAPVRGTVPASPKPAVAGPSGTQRISVPQGARPTVPAQPSALPKLSASGLPRLGSLPEPTAVAKSDGDESSAS